MNKINFENLPSTTMPLNAESLNTMQDNIEAEIETKISKTPQNISASDDFNNITETGIYQFGGINAANKPPNWGVVEVTNTNGYVLQKCYGSNSLVTRFSSDNGSNWGEWIKINNANITTGTEYETGRIIDGKKEYGKIIDIGALPNATSKAVAHGLNLSNIKFTAPPIGVASQSSGYTIPLPSISTSAQSWNVAILVEPTTIKITTGQNYSAYTGSVELRYTKN